MSVLQCAAHTLLFLLILLVRVDGRVPNSRNSRNSSSTYPAILSIGFIVNGRH